MSTTVYCVCDGDGKHVFATVDENTADGMVEDLNRKQKIIQVYLDNLDAVTTLAKANPDSVDRFLRSVDFKYNLNEVVLPAEKTFEKHSKTLA